MNDVLYCVPRLLWLSLTLCCSAIMMYQILDRIIYFSTNPVTVDVRMNFNTSLTFPSLTFCNQNAFRSVVLPPSACWSCGWMYWLCAHTETQTHRHTDTQAQSQTHTHTHGRTHRHTHRYTDRHTHRHTGTHTDTHTYTRAHRHRHTQTHKHRE